LPELIAFYEDHAADRDKFEVFAIHDDGVKSFSELDKKLVSIKKTHWQGKDLPCPVLLDGKNKTHKLYGIRSWPTGLLIDPEGKLVGEAGIGSLEVKLPAVSAAKKWARNRDIKKNVFWSFEPEENTLQHFAQILKRWAQCEITVDAEAVKACGLAADGPLPGVVIGTPITLRSLDELLLAPHGLGLGPSVDGKTLVIMKQGGEKEPVSYLQKLHAAELNERVDKKTGAEGATKPLDITDKPLIEAIKIINRESNLPMGLDAKAMQSGKLDPDAKVSGSVGPGQYRKGLVKLLAPLGLTVEVRDEVVIVVPVGKP